VTSAEDTGPAKEIRATGHIHGTKAKIKVARGAAQIVVRFDIDDDIDEVGAGDVDYLIGGLPAAVEQVMDALLAKKEATHG
jgi:hypothetical protein